MKFKPKKILKLLILFFVKPTADFPDEPKNNEANLAFLLRDRSAIGLILEFDPQPKWESFYGQWDAGELTQDVCKLTVGKTTSWWEEEGM